jgi:type VI secretion system protein ImpK
MVEFIERRTRPSLLKTKSGDLHGGTLFDLLYDGFYSVYLLRQGGTPEDGSQFRSRIVGYLDEFERRARKALFEADDIEAAKYAFSATVDEAILRSQYDMRAEWERRPLQLLLFGDHLAGEHFFSRLDGLRAQGVKRLRALEVFHMCLLLGFQGKYLLADAEKLEYVIARLGDEIAGLKDRPTGFAPHAMRPDQIVHQLRRGLRPWLLGTIFTVFGLTAYAAMEFDLQRTVERRTAGYEKLVRPTAPLADVTVTWP